MTAKPRKSTPRKRTEKAVASTPSTPHADLPETPYYDGRDGSGQFTSEEGTSAPEDQAVAAEAPEQDDNELVLLDHHAAAIAVDVEPEPSSEPISASGVGQELDPPLKSCAICGKPAVYETDGRAAKAVAYCGRDLPANVTAAMVEQYRVLSKR